MIFFHWIDQRTSMIIQVQEAGSIRYNIGDPAVVIHKQKWGVRKKSKGELNDEG